MISCIEDSQNYTDKKQTSRYQELEVVGRGVRLKRRMRGILCGDEVMLNLDFH